MNRIIDVAVEAPLPLLSYQTDKDLKIGQSVLVPLGKRKVSGVVLGPSQKIDQKIKYKKIISLEESKPILEKEFISWALWLSSYYHYPIGEVFKIFFPPMDVTKRKIKDILEDQNIIKKKEIELNEEQENCIHQITKKLDQFGVHLIFGVTGSGKTEVYLEIIKDVLKKNKTVSFLLPEISLTPQLIQRFLSYFPNEIAVLHSQLTPRQKTQQWWAFYQSEKKILIGARSALFCPNPDLGLIILDEEHESTFKQDSKLKYHARDAAIMLAKEKNIPIILGSASPSLESWYNAKTNKYFFYEMKKRALNTKMPELKIIDLIKEKKKNQKKMLTPWMSVDLHQALEENLKNKNQSALFLNRRGMAYSIQCYECGHIEECVNCNITLSLHGKKHLVCHYCNYSKVLEEICPECKSENYKALGLGTEKIEKDLKEIFPEAKIIRVDRDEITTRRQMEEVISKVENKKVDILIGTQMIAKGLDFKSLNLVGLILADIGFHLPDFRATERSFQIQVQMSGRAGRHQDKSLVIIQTYQPDHPSIDFHVKNDFEAFYTQELKIRKDFLYPPFVKMNLLILESNFLDRLKKDQKNLKDLSQKIKESDKRFKNLILLGPKPASIFKLKNKYRYQFLIKGNHQYLQIFTNQILKNLKSSQGVRLICDKDPYFI